MSNEPIWLVGACCGQHGRGTEEKSNQQVILTHWCLLWPAWLREGEEKQPTSRIDSLVLCVASEVEVEGEKSTNESLRLVGAVCGCRG